MRFSAENEELLKRFFKTPENREKEVVETREKVKALTDELSGTIESEYSTLIDACSALEDLWERTTKLKEVNETTSKLAKGLLKDAIENQKQERELVQCSQRITNIQQELGRIEDYLRSKEEVERLLKTIEAEEKSTEKGSAEKSTEEQNTWFLLTKAILKMDETIGLFKKYYFFGVFFEDLMNIRQRITDVVIKNTKRFLQQDWALFGNRIEVSREFKMFSDIKTRRKDVYDERTYETFYCIKKLMYLRPLIEDVIIATRRKMFEEVAKQCSSDPDSALYFYIGNIFLTYLLLETFPGIDTFYSQMFAGLQTLKSCRIELISKLRLVVEKLKISTVELDNIVENIVYKYFERELGRNRLSKLPNEEIGKKVLEGYQFLQSINSYEEEFDEIFIRNIDDSLTHMLMNTSSGDSFKRIGGVEDVIKQLRERSPYMKEYGFECISEGKRIAGKVAKEKIDELREFGQGNTTEDIVKKIISYKAIENKEFRSKFVEILNERITRMFDGKSKEEKALFLDTAKRNFEFHE